MATTTNNGQANFDTLVKESDLEKAGVTNILTSTTGSVFNIKLVNAANITHFKMYDAYSITYGTTVPDLVVHQVIQNQDFLPLLFLEVHNGII